MLRIDIQIYGLFLWLLEYRKTPQKTPKNNEILLDNLIGFRR